MTYHWLPLNILQSEIDIKILIFFLTVIKILCKLIMSWDSIYGKYIEVLESRDQLRVRFKSIVNADRGLKVTLAYQQLYLDEYLPKLVKIPRKSEEASITFRNIGNDAFHRMVDMEALKEYTKSIAAAPPDSELLALAYGNRSSVLFRMDRHRSSLLDINRALALPFPADHREKLKSRKNDCLDIIKEIQNETESVLVSIGGLLFG